MPADPIRSSFNDVQDERIYGFPLTREGRSKGRPGLEVEGRVGRTVEGRRSPHRPYCAPYRHSRVSGNPVVA